jgi:hypothetical protein
MNTSVRIIDSSEEFRSIATHISKTLYPDFAIKPLACKERVDPTFVKGIVVYEWEQPVACVALLLNPLLKYKKHSTCCAAFYECPDHADTASLLLKKACDEARKMGASYLIGPMNGSTWNYYRFTIHPHESPFLSEIYHQPYYVSQWEQHGFYTISRYHSFEDRHLQRFDSPFLEQYRQQTRHNAIGIRPIDMESFAQTLEQLHAFTAIAFAQNFLYTPISSDTFIQKYLNIQPLLQSDYMMVAKEHQEVVGLFLGIYDPFYPKQPQVIYKTVAKKPGRAYAGLVHLMMNDMQDTLKGQGITRAIHAFVHESNHSGGLSHKFNGHPIRAYVLLGKAL